MKENEFRKGGTDWQVGQNMRHIRTLRRVSIDELAARTGISEDALKDFEVGKMRPSGKELDDIAHALNAGHADFFAGNHPMDSKNDNESPKKL